MKIAVAQINFIVGDIAGNKQRIIDAIVRTRSEGAQLAVFAEFAVSGTPCYDLSRNAHFLDACEEAVREIAAHCTGIAALVGLPMQEGSGVAVIDNRQIIRHIYKNGIVNVGGRRVAVVVGGEGRATERADAVVVVASSPFARGRIEQRFERGRTMAFTAGQPLVFVNQVGGQSDVVYDGTSFVMDGTGHPLAVLKSFGEDFALIDTAIQPPIELPRQDRTRNTYNAIRLGINDFFRKNGFRKACLGMSGGIDSAVVLALAVEALGAENLKLLMLPSRFSSTHSVDDSIEMARTLGVEYEIISIEPAFDAVTQSLTSILGDTAFDTTEENIQSRLRCVMLMALANKRGYVLLNTSNKSEAAVGFGTLYGDMSGALGPIGDLYKVEVYALARYINREREVIPSNIILKEPSAELRPDQFDSDSLPPYEVMDAVLTRLVENGETPEEVIGAGFDDATVHRIAEMLRRAEFKRRQSPPALRLSQRPFGSDFRLPLLSKFVL
ncbi:MAG: NAD(+) synthase [Rikenellaceae bacterium]|nr:NAD(+) synthase [Rikenellaceae bacterium]MCL2691819.1 NAD(+) synthase [Rikenellaceae bacterium]